MSSEKQPVARLDIFSSSGQTIIPAAARIIREVALTVGIGAKQSRQSPAGAIIWMTWIWHTVDYFSFGADNESL